VAGEVPAERAGHDHDLFSSPFGSGPSRQLLTLL